jgi:flagellar FliL protein
MDIPEKLDDIESTPQAEKTPEKENKSISMKKLLKIGLPVVLIQIVVAYFVVGKFVVANDQPHGAETKIEDKKEEVDKRHSGEEPVLFVMKDIVVNPAGTNGLRFLLTTIAIEADSKEAVASLQKREVQVSDIVITILSSKTLADLDDSSYREALRKQILKELNKILAVGKLTNVYFSKFVIQ